MVMPRESGSLSIIAKGAEWASKVADGIGDGSAPAEAGVGTISGSVVEADGERTEEANKTDADAVWGGTLTLTPGWLSEISTSIFSCVTCSSSCLR